MRNIFYFIQQVKQQLVDYSNLISKFYPNPSQEFYLVYDIAPETEKEFENTRWDITQLEGYSGARNSALPFAVSLTELMKAVVL